MNNTEKLLMVVLCCSVIFASCHKVQNTSEPVSTYVPENTLPVHSSQSEQVVPTPPVDLDEVSFCMANFERYLTFDKDGLEMPDIKGFYQDELFEYENRVNKDDYGSREFYLEVAEYDLNGDGEADYIVKRTDPERSGGNYFEECFLDVVYQSNGELKRMYTDNRLLNVYNPIAILSTGTNGFRDIVVVNGGSNYKPVYAYNGICYVDKDFSNEKRVTFDRILSSADINAKLENNTIQLKYNFRMFSDDNSIDYQFFVAGLFISAEKNGIVKNSRLWACDENGEPKLFSTKELWTNFGWLDASFHGEYAGAGLSLYSDDLIWLDEAEIVIAQAIE